MLENNSGPVLLTVMDIAATLHLSKMGARHFVWRELEPLGGVVKVGNKLLVQAWALNKWLRTHTAKMDDAAMEKKRVRYAAQTEVLRRINAKERA